MVPADAAHPAGERSHARISHICSHLLDAGAEPPAIGRHLPAPCPAQLDGCASRRGLCAVLADTTTIDAFSSRGLDFLMDAFNRCTYLEDLTGLTQMHRETEAAIVDVDFFDDADDDDF